MLGCGGRGLLEAFQLPGGLEAAGELTQHPAQAAADAVHRRLADLDVQVGGVETLHLAEKPLDRQTAGDHSGPLSGYGTR